MTVRLILARPRPGTVGETRRVVHVFPLATDDAQLPHLTAYCGATFSRDDLDQLDRPTGMPCERCLRLTPSPAPAELPAG